MNDLMAGNVYLKGKAKITVAGFDKDDAFNLLKLEISLAETQARLLYNYASKPYVSQAYSLICFACSVMLCVMQVR